MVEFAITYKGKIRNSEDARRFWHLHGQRHRKIARHFAPLIFKEIKKQLFSFIDAIDSNGYDYAKSNIHSIVKFDGIGVLIKRLYHKGAFIEGNYVLNYLNRSHRKDMRLKVIGGAPFGLSLDSLAPIIEEYFKLHLLNNSAIPITEFTKKQIVKYLIEKIDQGEDLNTAVENFRQLAISWTGREGKALKRANRIALTETTRCMSFGGLIGAYMSGVDLDKVWVTSEDERVRGARGYAKFPHTRLDLQKASLMSPFYNGEAIAFPGDPSASIENTAMCRCALYYKEKIKPKPRVTRSLSRFLIDFFTGFLLGEAIG